MNATNRALYARMLTHVKPYRLVFAGAVFAMMVGGAAQALFLPFLNWLLDMLFAQGQSQYALIASFGIVVIFMITGISNFASGYGMQWVGNRVIMDLRSRMFQRVIRLPEPFFSGTSTGALMSKVTYDVLGILEATTNTLTALVRGSVTLVGALVWMFVISWKLTLIIFAAVPILALIIGAFNRRLRKISREAQVAQGAITSVLEESIRGHKVIKVFGGEAYEAKRFDAAANRIRSLNVKHGAAAAAGTPFTHLVVSIAIASIVYLAASRTLGTGLELPDFITYIVAAAGLIPQLKGLTGVGEQIQKGLASAESVFALIDTQTEVDTGSISLDRAQGRIDFSGVGLQYENQTAPALHDVTLTISPGETVALVGPSGGGKTSLINLLPRFFTPTAGGITLDGHALADIKLTDLRRQIALVSQDVVLFNDSVAANIAYGVSADAAADKDKIRRAAEAAHCIDFINALPDGFDTNIGDNGSRLSGGQRQRLAIARAIFKDAPILLLDEATSALDSESERAVQSALDTLMKGRTTLVVAHRLSTIENADRIVVMENGRIAEIGSHAELLARNGTYSVLQRMQFAGA
ncbi:MAG: lipid A export permease/ATP-binding protein MsbA [Betaproteobacteria bacterium]